MAHHSAADLATIFDPDFGEGERATIGAGAAAYTANAIVNKSFERFDESSGVAEKITVLQFITDDLTSPPLARGTSVVIGSRTYSIQQLVEQDTYVSSYAVI